MSRALSRRNLFHIGQMIGGVLNTTQITAQSTSNTYQTVNIPKIGVNDSVLVTVQNPTSQVLFDAYVSGPGVVTIRATNISTGNITPNASTFQVMVLKR